MQEFSIYHSGGGQIGYATHFQLRRPGALTEIGEVAVKDAYRDYTPPMNAAKIVRRLLAAIPSKYVRGLDCVVLTNLSGQPRRHRLGKTTSRGKRVPQSRVLGRYHRKWKGQPPWIELYIDRILSRLPRWAIRIRPLRDVTVGQTLYHELGHHVHLFIRPEFREKEDVADDWGKKLSGHFLRHEYWYLIPVLKFILLFRK
jgi:hypothetical protein